MRLFEWLRQAFPARRTFESVLLDIQTNPIDHAHGYEALHRCCMIKGALDLRLMDAHGQYVNLGTNGGKKCDVLDGPCACGAWHQPRQGEL